ncbi:MAG: hypothetical protein ACFFB8_05370 [Promethearchaeota archaeon]
MVNIIFWKIVENYNTLMSSAIEGPNCTTVCKGDCCSITIDIPKILAKEYIKRGYATKDDFIRSNVFSFKLRFDEHKGKCFLFDKSINGCIVHNSGIKPPQCWIYPTNFSNPENRDISCKKANGWKIIDTQKAKEAEKLLKYYVFLCEIEAKKEIKKIKHRLSISIFENSLKTILLSTIPHQLAGFKDTWDRITILLAQGVSLQVKKFCKKYNKKCDYIKNQNFLDCQSICEKVSIGLLEFLEQKLYKYVQKNPDSEGEYPLFKLTELNNG